MQIRSGSHYSGVRLTAAALVWLAWLGCASSGALPPAGPPRVDRPEASAGYDVLVGELALREGRPQESRAAYERAVAKDPGSSFLHRRLALLAAQLGDVGAAVDHAEHATELNPDGIEERLFLGRLMRLGRNLPGAERALLGDDGEPIDAEAARMLAQLYLGAGPERMEAAIEAARDAVRLGPEALVSHALLATAFERAHRLGDAEAALRAALDLLPGDAANIYSRIARLHRSAGRRDLEIAVYREALQADPGHYGLLLTLGEAQLAVEDKEGALETFRALVEAHPRDLAALGRLAGLEVTVGHPARAAELLEIGLREHPDRPGLAYVLGQLRAELGDLDAAIRAYRRVPAEHPRFSDARLRLTVIFEERRQYRAALEALRPLLQAGAERALQFHAANLRARVGDLDGAVGLLESLLASDPNDAEVLYQLGVVYGVADRVDEALQYMHASLEHDGDNAQALNYIAYTWVERGERLDEAEALIERALELRPGDGYIIDSLGWVYYKRAQPYLRAGRLADGERWLERSRQELLRAAKLAGGDPVVAEHLGDVHRMLNQKRRAFEFYLRAADMEPRLDEQPHLYDKIEALRRELGAP